MSANDDPQIGGNHYRRGKYQHWDLVATLGWGYFEGNATKYVARWRFKGQPLEDLKKALHYHNKFIENSGRIWAKPLPLREEYARAEVHCFCVENELGDLEKAYLATMAVWKTTEDLVAAREFLLLMFDSAEAETLAQLPGALDAEGPPIDHPSVDPNIPPAPVPLEDSNKHAERADEN